MCGEYGEALRITGAKAWRRTHEVGQSTSSSNERLMAAYPGCLAPTAHHFSKRAVREVEHIHEDRTGRDGFLARWRDLLPL